VLRKSRLIHSYDAIHERSALLLDQVNAGLLLTGGCGRDGGRDGVPEEIACLRRYFLDRSSERWGMKKKLGVYTIIYHFCFSIIPLQALAAEIFDESHIVWNPPRNNKPKRYISTWFRCGKGFCALLDTVCTGRTIEPRCFSLLQLRVLAVLRSRSIFVRLRLQLQLVKNSGSGSSSCHFPHIIEKNLTIFMVSKNIHVF
jgi:hypothetical protein